MSYARDALLYETLRYTLIECENQWGTRPFAVLACSGYEDEHWQVYHPSDLTIPRFVLDKEGHLLHHPDYLSMAHKVD